jgi:hypothetical protein
LGDARTAVIGVASGAPARPVPAEESCMHASRPAAATAPVASERRGIAGAGGVIFLEWVWPGDSPAESHDASFVRAPLEAKR